MTRDRRRGRCRRSPRAVTLGAVKSLESVRAAYGRSTRSAPTCCSRRCSWSPPSSTSRSSRTDGQDRGSRSLAGAVAVSGLAFRRRDPLLAAVIFVVPAVIQAPAGRLPHRRHHRAVRRGDPAVLLGRAATPAAGASGSRSRVTLVGMLATLGIESGLTADDALWAGLPVRPARRWRAAPSAAECCSRPNCARRPRDVEAKRVERARSVIEDERARIAAELQALVANGLSAMVVQAETVPRALAAGDSAGAGVALAAVEETGRDALTEMRRLLGVLRRDGDGPELAPQPGLGARSRCWWSAMREQGLDVDVARRGRGAAARARRRPHRLPRARGRARGRRREGGLARPT